MWSMSSRFRSFFCNQILIFFLIEHWKRPRTSQRLSMCFTFKIHSSDENTTQDTERNICFGTPLTVQLYLSIADCENTRISFWMDSFFLMKSPRGSEKKTKNKPSNKSHYKNILGHYQVHHWLLCRVPHLMHSLTKLQRVLNRFNRIRI